MTTLEIITIYIIVISCLFAFTIVIGLYFGLEPRNNMTILKKRFNNRHFGVDELEENAEFVENIPFKENQSMVETTEMKTIVMTQGKLPFWR